MLCEIRFHPCFQGRQHTVCSNARFRPRTHRARTSPACLDGLAPVNVAGSLSLSARSSIPRPSPCRPLLPTVSRRSSLLRRLCQSRQVSFRAGDPHFTYTNFQPFCLQSPGRLPSPLSAMFQREGLYDSAPVHPWLLGTLEPLWASPYPTQARQSCLAESSSSLSYGPVVHLALLPTPPCGDAVTFSYVRIHARTAGTFTLLFVCARGRTGKRLTAPLRTSVKRGWTPRWACLLARVSLLVRQETANPSKRWGSAS